MFDTASITFASLFFVTPMPILSLPLTNMGGPLVLGVYTTAAVMKTSWSGPRKGIELDELGTNVKAIHG